MNIIKKERTNVHLVVKEMENRIYLDNSATTKVDDDILQEVVQYFNVNYGNASGVCKESRVVKRVIDKSRLYVAELINADEEEIYFTSGGSESDNWALRCLLQKSDKKHIVASKIEHHAILNTCEYLQSIGYEVTYVDVDEKGYVKLDELEKAVRQDTLIVSIMLANNEIGTIQNIEKIAEIAHKKGAVFHTDAVQAIGKVDIDVKKMNIDMLSVSGHKIHAFQGIGALYINKNISITSLIYGGSQESGKRAGTYNVAGIYSLGLACKKLKNNYEEKIKIKKLRDYFIDKVLEQIDDVIITGDKKNRLINNVHFCFKNVNSDTLLILLDKGGISASIASACMSGSIQRSHVLTAIGISDDYINGNIRFSLSKYNNFEEIDTVVYELKKNIGKLRKS